MQNISNNTSNGEGSDTAENGTSTDDPSDSNTDA